MQILPSNLTAESAWSAYDAFVRSIMPPDEARALLFHARKAHDRRWKQRERLRHEIRHRKVTEDDYE